MDITGFEPVLYAPPHILSLKSFKFQVQNSKFVSPRNFSLFYYSLSNKLYERLCCNLYSCAFLFDLLILSLSVLLVLLFGGE